MYEKITLSNGVRIVFEKVDYVRSASAGIWIGNGSRHEDAGSGGISHFIEHMMFKGTEKRTAADIAAQMDEIGGQTNAFTTPECTVYYARTLDTHLSRALDILTDMLLCSRFDEKDVETERGVILEEIGMVEDTPDDLVTERLSERCFSGSPLGAPVLGTAEALSTLTGKKMKKYVGGKYTGESAVLALSGNFSSSDLDFAANRLEALSAGKKNTFLPAKYTPAFVTKKKAIEQNHLCIGFEAPPFTSEEKYAVQLLNGLIGAGMSSRLYQSVREKQGLCYTIYSYYSAHEDTGLFNIYTATNKSTEAKALEAICGELREFMKNGPDKVELERVREQHKANMLMGLESTSARMNHIGRSELFFDRVPEYDEIISRYDNIDAQMLTQTARRLFDFAKISFSAVGRVSAVTSYKPLIG